MEPPNYYVTLYLTYIFSLLLWWATRPMYMQQGPTLGQQQCGQDDRKVYYQGRSSSLTNLTDTWVWNRGWSWLN